MAEILPWAAAAYVVLGILAIAWSARSAKPIPRERVSLIIAYRIGPNTWRCE